LHQIDGLVFGEDPRQGYVADDVFYHPELRFQFPVPAGWKLNNTPTQVQVMSKKQDGIILFSVERGASPEAVARQFIAKSKARVIRFDRIAVNGLPAHRVISHMTTQQGAIRVMSYFIDKDGRIYVFHGFTSQPLFQGYASVFANTMGGFKPLTAPNRINVKPERVRIRSIGRSTTLKEALTTLGVPEKRLEEMALLNGRRLTDTIPANTLLKVVTKGN
jgi:predicted Zn-dependent protease